jgi:hypothetical protein
LRKILLGRFPPLVTGLPAYIARRRHAIQGASVYQLTDKGLALQATLQSTKYWTSDKLD